jgi:hypothetical protein
MLPSLLLEGLLQNYRPLLIRMSVLQLAAVAASVVLFPSVTAAFLRHAAGAVPVRLLRLPPRRHGPSQSASADAM